jgi:transposase InsO family protein
VVPPPPAALPPPLQPAGGLDETSYPFRKPELLATGPNEVWSWDITKLLGPATWTYYYLYVILARGFCRNFFRWYNEEHRNTTTRASAS